MNMGMNILKGAVAAVLLGTGFAAAATPLVQVQHNVPVAVSKATLIGHHNPRSTLAITVGLRLRNTDQLDALMRDIYTRGSPDFHHFLDRDQFRTQFGPTQDDVNAVISFLKQQGVSVNPTKDVSYGRTLIHARASTATIESAFGVTINNYTLNGKTFYAASTNPSIPATLGTRVLSVMGLDDAVQLVPHSIKSPAPKGGGLGIGGFSPLQIQTAYGLWDLTDATQATSSDGTNTAAVKIGIATAFSFRRADLTHFWSHYGLPDHTVVIHSVDGVTRQLNGETTLDIERSGAMSPGSEIHVYEGSSPKFTTFVDVFDAIANDSSPVDVVSTSWGSPEPDNSNPTATQFSTLVQESQVYQQLALAGIPVFAAAGDNGAADGTVDSSHADYPSSDPNVVAAGGTSLFLNPDNTIASESAWSGAGGADSLLFAQPAYQGGVVNANGFCIDDTFTNGGIDAGVACLGAGNDSRQSSDMAMDADPATGYSIYFNGRWEVFGGTSFVAPELAGFFAVVTARYRTSVISNTALVGNGNALIYAEAAANSGDFNDITTGSNGFSAGAGWDHPTGFGTPKNGDTMANDMVALLPH